MYAHRHKYCHPLSVNNTVDEPPTATGCPRNLPCISNAVVIHSAFSATSQSGAVPLITQCSTFQPLACCYPRGLVDCLFQWHCFSLPSRRVQDSMLASVAQPVICKPPKRVLPACCWHATGEKPPSNTAPQLSKDKMKHLNIVSVFVLGMMYVDLLTPSLSTKMVAAQKYETTTKTDCGKCKERVASNVHCSPLRMALHIFQGALKPQATCGLCSSLASTVTRFICDWFQAEMPIATDNPL